MASKCTPQEKELFSQIMFETNNQIAKQKAMNLPNDAKFKLKKIYDQKISFECAYKPIRPIAINQNIIQQPEQSTVPNFFGSICCCLFPQDNRDIFDITNEIFIKRFFATFLFWRKGFIRVGGGRSELYGPIWLGAVYILLVGLITNLQANFTDSIEFEFKQQNYVTCLGLVLLFKGSQILFYPPIIKCLGGFITTEETACIIGYSLILYYIPTIFCVFTSLAWYVTALAIANITRSIFLFRNLSQKLDSKKFILAVINLAIETFYMYIILMSLFNKYSGYTYTDGIGQLFNTNTVLTDRQLPSHFFALRNLSHAMS